MDDATKNKIYDVLVEECGAYDSDDSRAEFCFHFPECGEYRFQGKLGFGGKVWAGYNRIYVNCYKEDATPERLAMIKRANELLDEFAQ